MLTRIEKRTLPRDTHFDGLGTGGDASSCGHELVSTAPRVDTACSYGGDGPNAPMSLLYLHLQLLRLTHLVHDFFQH